MNENALNAMYTYFGGIKKLVFEIAVESECSEETNKKLEFLLYCKETKRRPLMLPEMYGDLLKLIDR